MFTLSFNFLIFQNGELDQTIEDHRVTFDSPEALAEAMTVLAAMGTSMTDVQSLVSEIALRTRCAHILPITMITGGFNVRTCILVQSTKRVTLPTPEILKDPKLGGQEGLLVAMALRTSGTDQVISLSGRR